MKFKVLGLIALFVIFVAQGVPVWATDVEISVSVGDPTVFTVTTDYDVECNLDIYSSAHQEGHYNMSENFSVTIGPWTEGSATLTCDGVSYGGKQDEDTGVSQLQHGYTAKVVFVREEVTPGVDSITVSHTEIPVDDYYTYVVHVSGDTYTPTCEIVSEMASIGATQYQPITSFPTIVNHGPEGIKYTSTLTCDGVSQSVDFMGNYGPDGEVVLERTSNGTHRGGGGRAGSSAKPFIPDDTPYVDDLTLRCVIGNVKITWTGDVLAWGPEDIGTSTTNIQLAFAGSQEIADAVPTVEGTFVGTTTGFVKVFVTTDASQTGEQERVLRVDVVNPASPEKTARCWLNTDGSVRRTDWVIR